MFSLTPDYQFKDVTKIDRSIFQGKKLIIFDIDNTLFLPESTIIREDILKAFKEISSKQTTICLSNSNTRERRQDSISKILNVDIYQNKRKKPSNRLFKEVCDRYNVTPKEIIIIGDMRITDVLFGNRNGAITVLVDPLGNEKLKRIAIVRLLENTFVRLFPHHRER